MATFKVKYSVIKEGFFSDTVLNDVEIVEADTHEEAIEEVKRKARRLIPGQPILIQDVEKL